LRILFAQVSNDAKLGARGSISSVRGSGRSRGWGICVALLMVLGLGDACYQGGERDKDPPPGLFGGLCLAPDGHCQEGMCNQARNFCYDPFDPCSGFFCGGEDRGLCVPDDEGLPSCQCNVGFNNERYDLYCCPEPGGPYDAVCLDAPSSG
jgi:hypothetical protein